MVVPRPALLAQHSPLKSRQRRWRLIQSPAEHEPLIGCGKGKNKGGNKCIHKGENMPAAGAETFFWEVAQMPHFLGGVTTTPRPHPRVSQHVAGLFAKKQIHLTGGFLLAGSRLNPPGKFCFDVICLCKLKLQNTFS